MVNTSSKSSIHQLEDSLFQKYHSLLDSEKVSPDGLHYLGDFYYTNDCWGRDPGNEEEEWYHYCAQKRGLVVLTKDLNDDTAWDIREEHARKNGVPTPTPTEHIFYRNLRRWVYALLNIDSQGYIPDYPDIKTAQEAFETKPWVRINLKKVPGGSSLDNAVLAESVKCSYDLLLEQLCIYQDASIYLDCTRCVGIELLKVLYDDIKPFGDGDDEWVYFSEKKRLLIINSYHPSYRIPGGEEAYYLRMQSAIRLFYQSYPNFLHM